MAQTINNFHSCFLAKRVSFISLRTIVAILFCFLISNSAFAQQGELKGLDVDIIKSYSPILANPVKLNFPASTVTADTVKPNMKYTVVPRLLNLPFIPPDIRPLAMVKDEKGNSQNNYLKAGFGTQWSPLGELYLNTKPSEKYDAGLYAYHLSGSGDLKYQKFSDNIVQINGKRFFKSNAVSLVARYDNNAFNYYGYDHNDTSRIVLDAIAQKMHQRFSKFSGALNFGNTKENKSDFNYNFNFGFYNVQDLFHAKETNLNTSLDLEKELKKVHHLHLKLFNDNFSFSQDSLKFSTNLFHINPYYRITQKNWSLTGGFNVVIPNKGNVFFFPKIEGEYKLADKYLIPFAGFDGEVNKNNFMGLTSVNPYINKHQPQDYSKIYNIYGGAKGSMGNHFSYLLKISERLYDFLPYFLNDSINVTRFDVNYYQNAGVFNVHGEIGYRESEHINVILGGDYYGYQLDFNDTAIGYPNSRLSVEADYNIKDKIIVGANVFAYSKSFAQLPKEQLKTALKGVLDVNISIQYNYKKNFAAFLNINNITAAKYQRWYRYQGYGFNLIGGLILKF